MSAPKAKDFKGFNLLVPTRLKKFSQVFNKEVTVQLDSLLENDKIRPKPTYIGYVFVSELELKKIKNLPIKEGDLKKDGIKIKKVAKNFDGSECQIIIEPIEDFLTKDWLVVEAAYLVGIEDSDLIEEIQNWT